MPNLWNKDIRRCTSCNHLSFVKQYESTIYPSCLRVPILDVLEYKSYFHFIDVTALLLHLINLILKKYTWGWWWGVAGTTILKVDGFLLLKCSTGVFRTPQGSPCVGCNTLFLSSPHLCFILVFILDLIVFHYDPLMS